MCSDGGRDSAQAAAALAGAGYSQVLQMEGGFAGYSAVWSPSGKRRPPAGRWVSTGEQGDRGRQQAWSACTRGLGAWLAGMQSW